MGFSPCCFPLQTGTKAIAVYDMVVGGLLFLIGLFLAIAGSLAPSPDETGAPIGGIAIGLGLVIVVLAILRIFFGVLLWQAARDLNEKKCRAWIIVSVIGLVIGIINLVVSISTGSLVGRTVLGGAGLVLEAYLIWVVVEFRKEILGREPPQQQSGGHTYATVNVT